MTHADEQTNSPAGAPVDQTERMIEAGARATGTLNLDDLLRGAVDGACSLTGARQGTVALLDGQGRLQRAISSPLGTRPRHPTVDLPGGMGMYHYLSGLTEPLRLADLDALSRELGLPELGPPVGPLGALLAAPIWYEGRRVGGIFLVKAVGDPEFTAEDEGVLALYAAQAALAITGAQHDRDEQLAQANLDALIDASPVGVAVFDAPSGALTSINREALRIVDGLRHPDQSIEQLMETLTCRRLDGAELSLDGSVLVKLLNSGATVRAEEIMLEAPDGRQVNTIINAAPIRSPEGGPNSGIASVVVTLQDLTPIEEVDRQRAEFFGLVSRELLGPLTSIKGSAAAVRQDLAWLDPARAQEFFNLIESQADQMRRQIANLEQVARIEAGTLLLRPEPTDLGSLVNQARDAFLAQREDRVEHPLEVDLPDHLPRVAADRARTLHVLDHLLANAAAYSREGFPITVSARQAGAEVELCVSDQGHGLGSQSLSLIFRRLSRRESDPDAATGDVSLGLAVCQGIVEAHGGRLWAESDGPGMGSRFRFTLPLAEDPAVEAKAGLRRAARTAEGGQGRVLLVDNDPQAVWHLRNTLSEAGYTLSVGRDEEELEELIALERPHLVLLGGVPSRTDRIGLIRRVQTLIDAPLLLLSDPGATLDRELARALDAGADDYIVRPFSPNELVARVGAALRRLEAPYRAPSRASFELDGLTIDYGQRRVALDGRALSLTATEYRLLCELALHQGLALSREQLMRRVWSARDVEEQGVVRAYVKRLRRKLGDSAHDPRFIFNEPRIGYRLGQPAQPDGPLN